MKNILIATLLMLATQTTFALNQSTSDGPWQVAPVTASGSVLGKTASATIAFHGATPSEQRAGSAQASVVTTASTSATNAFGYATQAQADAIVALVNELRAALVAKGLIKGSN